MKTKVKSSVIKIIEIFFIFIFFSFSIFFALLIYGIKIDKINYNNYIINGLYLKLEKKLILNIDKISTPKTTTKQSNNKVDIKNINLILNILPIFSKISINVDNNKFIYQNNKIFVNNKYASFYIQLNTLFDRINFKIHNLYLKQYKLNIPKVIGNYKPSLKNHIKAIAYLSDIKLYLDIELKDYIKIKAHSNRFKDMKALENIFTPFLKEWIYDKYKAQNYKVINLYFKYDKKLYFSIDLNTKNSILNIDKKLNNIFIKNTNIHYSTKDNLKIDAYNLILDNIKIDKLYLTLQKYLSLTLYTHTLVDKNLKYLLSKYNINLPITQTKGQNFFKVKIDIKDKPNIKVNGKLQNSLFKIKNIYIKANKSYLNLKNDKLLMDINVANIKIDKLNIYAYDTKIKLNKFLTITNNLSVINKIKTHNNKVIIKDNKVYISAISYALFQRSVKNLLKLFNIDIPIYQLKGKNKTSIKLIIDNKTHINVDSNITNSVFKTFNKKIYSKYLNLKFDKYLFLKGDLNYKENNISLNLNILDSILKDNIFNIKSKTNFRLDSIIDINKTLNISYDINNKILHIPTIDTNLTFNPLKISTSLNKIYPYVNILKKYNIKDGNATIILDKNITTIYTNLNYPQKIIKKDNKYLTKFKPTIIIKNKNIFIKDKNINIKIDKNITAKIKNLDFDVTTILKQTKTSSNSNNTMKNIYIKFNNSNFYLKKMKLLSNRAILILDNNKFKFDNYYKTSKITIAKNKDLIIKATNINNEILNNLFHIDSIKKVNLDLIAIQKQNHHYLEGNINIKDIVIKDMILLNNIIAFINTVPSILTLSPLDFTTEGYKAKGNIDFLYANNIFYIKDAKLYGKHLNIFSEGYMDLKKNKISMNVKAIVLIRLLNKIPIVNYIILGKNGGVTINLNVTGKLDNPKVSKNIIKNLAEIPLNLIYRTITSPFEFLFE